METNGRYDIQTVTDSCGAIVWSSWTPRKQLPGAAVERKGSSHGQREGDGKGRLEYTY